MNTASVMLIIEVLTLSVVTAVLWWARHRIFLSNSRLRLISIRMRFVQLSATGILPGGNLAWLLDQATTASLDDKRGLTLWTLAQSERNLKGRAADAQIQTLVNELEVADIQVRKLFVDYVSAEKSLLMERSPFLVLGIKTLFHCGRIAHEIKRVVSPVLMLDGKQTLKAYVFYERLDVQLHEPTRLRRVFAVVG